MSLSGAKQTWAVALHMSAFDPKRTCRFWQKRWRAGLPVTARIQKADTGEDDRINVLSPFWRSHEVQAQIGGSNMLSSLETAEAESSAPKKTAKPAEGGVTHFRQILLWPVQLMPLKEGQQIHSHWELLE